MSDNENQFLINFNPDFKSWDIARKRWVDAYFEAQACFYDSGKYRLHSFTGILDKNGNKIYHSDILLLDDVAVKFMDAERNHVLVGFCNGAFMYGRYLDPYHLNTYLWLYSKYCTVVGNIYENKDLIDFTEKLS